MKGDPSQHQPGELTIEMGRNHDRLGSWLSRAPSSVMHTLIARSSLRHQLLVDHEDGGNTALFQEAE
jgi:hypothetical protein